MPNDIKIDIDGLNAEKLLGYCQQVEEPVPSLLKPMKRNRNTPFIAAPAENGEIVKRAEFNAHTIDCLVKINHNLHPAWYLWPEGNKPEERETLDYKFSRAQIIEVDGFKKTIIGYSYPDAGGRIMHVNAASFEWCEKIKHPEPEWEGKVKEMRREILDFKESKELQIYETCHTKEGLGYIPTDHEARIAALCDFVDQGSAEYATLKLHVAAARMFVEHKISPLLPDGSYPDSPYSKLVAVTPEEELTRSIGTLILAKEFNINYENKNMLAMINQAKQPFSRNEDKLHEALTSALDDAINRVEFLQHPKYTLDPRKTPAQRTSVKPMLTTSMTVRNRSYKGGYR